MSAAAALARTVTGIPGSGKWFVLACVGIAVVVGLRLRRRDLRAFDLALVSSASALTIGAALGFALVGMLTGKLLPLLLAAKWGIAAAFLTWFFGRLLGRPATEEEFEAMAPPTILDELMARYGKGSPEELWAHLNSRPEEEQREVIAEIEEWTVARIDEVEIIMKRAMRFRLASIVCVLIGTSLLVVVHLLLRPG